MKIGKIDTDKKVFVVAEIGNNHEGNFDLAKKMIIEAADAGVDAVKFQTFIPEQFVSFKNQSRLNRLRSFKYISPRILLSVSFSTSLLNKAYIS